LCFLVNAGLITKFRGKSRAVTGELVLSAEAANAVFTKGSKEESDYAGSEAVGARVFMIRGVAI
jgi:hypothetical protein